MTNLRESNKILMQVIGPCMFAASILLAWSFITTVLQIPEYLFPSPGAIWNVFIGDFEYLLKHSSITLLEALLGFLVAVIVGFMLGTIFAVFGLLELMILPFAIASQAVPIVALAPLLILWMGNGIASKVTMAALICFFPMIVNTTRGLRSVKTQELDLFKVFSANKWQEFWKLRFPASLSYVISGMRISAALAMIGAIVAEYAGADIGIGYIIIQSMYRLDTPLLFASIISSAIGGLLLFGGVVMIEHIFLSPYRTRE